MRLPQYFKLMLTTSVLYSCGHQTIPTDIPTIPSIPEIKTETPTTDTTVVKPVEIKNFDLEFQYKLKDVSFLSILLKSLVSTTRLLLLT